VTNPPETVKSVNLDEYQGVWYEIASFPASFQKHCKCTRAEYIQKEKYVRVINTCYKTNKNKYQTAKGKAWPVEGSNNSKLKVQFFWPFKGDYWILHLEEDYSTALVGSPDYKYLWILHRNQSMSENELGRMKNIASEKGYDVRRLTVTAQDCIDN
jgi:apolipoprotein D and lipocalin family protein